MQWKHGLAFLMVAGLLAGGYAFMGSSAANEAIAAGDYEAWKAAMTEELTEERFQQLQQRYGQEQQREQYMEQVRAAIESGDYDAWKTAMTQLEQPRITDIITEDNFGTYVQMQNAMESGDFETAEQLREQLGIEAGFGMMGMRGFGHGMHGFGPMGCGCGQDSEVTGGSDL